MGNIEKFNQVASRYDTSERIEIAKIIADSIRENIKNSTDKTVIDYGCGTGLVGMRLLQDFSSVLFIDASDKMIEIVKQKIHQNGIKNAEAFCYDFELENPPQQLRADYIILVQTLLHIKEVNHILSELYNILNKGGHLLIVDFDKNYSVNSDEVHNGFVQNELIKTLKSVGFITAESKTFYHGEKLFMNQDASMFILDAIK